jgi:hypothetical protein
MLAQRLDQISRYTLPRPGLFEKGTQFEKKIEQRKIEIMPQ